MDEIRRRAIYDVERRVRGRALICAYVQHLCIRPVRKVDAGDEECRCELRFTNEAQQSVDELLFARLRPGSDIV